MCTYYNFLGDNARGLRLRGDMILHGWTTGLVKQVVGSIKMVFHVIVVSSEISDLNSFRHGNYKFLNGLSS